jgi:hypothetical protein
MLERISLDKNLVEWRPERKISTRRHQNSRQTQDKLNALTARFRNALKKSVEGIIEAGLVLIQAKSELEHGQFTDWVVNELRFGTRKVGVRDADIRKAEMLMFLARNEVISNPCHWHDFPPSPRSLWELTHIAKRMGYHEGRRANLLSGLSNRLDSRKHETEEPESRCDSK